jgi:hypothetical protein
MVLDDGRDQSSHLVEIYLDHALLLTEDNGAEVYDAIHLDASMPCLITKKGALVRRL